MTDEKIRLLSSKFRIDEFQAFVEAREQVRINREKFSDPADWTDDIILRTFRFCNVRREDDRTTRWFREYWWRRYAKHPDIWFASMVCRFINDQESMEELPHPLQFNADTYKSILRERSNRGQRVFSPAYTISTHGLPVSKIEFIVDHALAPAWEARETVRPKRDMTLMEYSILLQKNLYGIKSFMAGQIIADIKYDGPLSDASDWETFAVQGPGSRRGLARLMSLPANHRWARWEWETEFRDLWTVWNGLRTFVKLDHAQDLQNCLCEFDKYERARTGQGRPKQSFKPYEGSFK